MGKITFKDKIIKFFVDIKNSIRYYFAKQWLDEHFGHVLGKQEFWGSYLMENLNCNFEHGIPYIHETITEIIPEGSFSEFNIKIETEKMRLVRCLMDDLVRKNVIKFELIENPTMFNKTLKCHLSVLE